MSAISFLDLAILSAALLGDRTRNLGALIARRLSFNAEKGATFGCIFALLVVERLDLPMHPDTEAFGEGRPLKMSSEEKVLSKKNATRRMLKLDEDVVFLLVSLFLFES